MEKPILHIGKVSRVLLTLNITIALVYFAWWFQLSHVASFWMYGLLFLGEFYHIFMTITFWYTIWPGKAHPLLPLHTNFQPTIDVFITVAGEPITIIRQTAIAAKNMRGYKKNIYLLNDGLAAKKDNWQAVEALAKDLDIYCITRTKSHGAKAGNINNTLKQTQGELVVIFDADMTAHPDFLEKTIPYFQDEKIGFIQTPQYYNNWAMNGLTRGAWEQQEFFYGAILQGKEKSNAVFICGTNVAIRRTALEQVGGMNEENIAEDFVTSIFIHQKGWKSYYVPEVLAEGLAPEDMGSYYKQQLRWARGSVEVLFTNNPLFKRGLTWGQKVQYLSSALFYFNGIILLIDSVMPILFLFTGVQAVAAATTSFALFFIPFMFANLYTLYLASDRSITFRAISFSQSTWTLQMQALFSILTGRKMAFAVTPKQAQSGNFLFLVTPHILYAVAAAISIGIGIHREGIDPAIVTNVAWAIFNVVLFSPFIRAGMNMEGSNSYMLEPA